MFRRVALVHFIIASLSSSQVRAQEDIGNLAVGATYIALGSYALVKLSRGNCCAELKVGSDVRFSRKDALFPAARAVVTAIDADSVTVKWNSDSTTRIAVGRISSLSVKNGSYSLWAKGWAVGLLTGAGIGAVTGLASGDDPPDSFLQWSAEEKAAMIGTYFGVIGSIVGAVVGAPMRAERWDRVERHRVTPIMAPGKKAGTRLGLQLRF